MHHTNVYTVYYSFKDQINILQQEEIISENAGCLWEGFFDYFF